MLPIHAEAYDIAALLVAWPILVIEVLIVLALVRHICSNILGVGLIMFAANCLTYFALVHCHPILTWLPDLHVVIRIAITEALIVAVEWLVLFAFITGKHEAAPGYCARRSLLAVVAGNAFSFCAGLLVSMVGILSNR